MTTLFISDLHLDAKQPHLTALFLNFLTQEAVKADAIYILGDFMEVWVGDDYQTDYTRQIIKAMEIASKQTQLFLMHGNRDFLMGKAFASSCGATLINDPTVINLYGERILLMHGDGLCTQDRLHQAYRKLVRSKIFKMLFLMLPLKTRLKIAEKMRASSQQRGQRLSQELMDIDFSLIPKLFKKYKVKTFIYGHTHRPSIYFQKYGFCYVLSDWHKLGNMLVCENDQRKQLIYFDK